jgi:hypothetical protein
MINYDNRTFRSVSSSENGNVSNETVFEYQQAGDLVSATYTGGDIEFGHLIGIVDASGSIDIRYHHLNMLGQLMTGICFSTPQVMDDGRIRLYEKWKWTSGDESEGESILEEVLRSVNQETADF